MKQHLKVYQQMKMAKLSSVARFSFLFLKVYLPDPLGKINIRSINTDNKRHGMTNV